METGDICPYCLDADCPSTKETCVGRFRDFNEALKAKWPLAPVTMCGFCYGAGGYRVPCHGCGVVGPVAVSA